MNCIPHELSGGEIGAGPPGDASRGKVDPDLWRASRGGRGQPSVPTTGAGPMVELGGDLACPDSEGQQIREGSCGDNLFPKVMPLWGCDERPCPLPQGFLDGGGEGTQQAQLWQEAQSPLECPSGYWDYAVVEVLFPEEGRYVVRLGGIVVAEFIPRERPGRHRRPTGARGHGLQFGEALRARGFVGEEPQGVGEDAQ